MFEQLISDIIRQLKSLKEVILDHEPFKITNKPQEVMQRAQVIATNFLCAFIYFILLLFLLKQALLLLVIPLHWLDPFFGWVKSFRWAKAYHWSTLLRYSPTRNIAYGGFLLLIFVFLHTMQFLLQVTRVIRSYRVFSFVGVLVTLWAIFKNAEHLFTAESPFGGMLNLLWKAVK